METFKYWIISNLEVIGALICLCLFLLVSSSFGDVKDLDSLPGIKKVGIYGIFSFALFAFLAKKGGLGLLVKSIALAIVIIVFGSALYSAYISNHFGLFFSELVIMIVSLLISVFVAIFTFNNFEEVVSRRMLWRNSNVSLFEIKWIYTTDRFVVCWCLSIILLYFILSLFV